MVFAAGAARSAVAWRYESIQAAVASLAIKGSPATGRRPRG